jgi:hypothetical protein
MRQRPIRSHPRREVLQEGREELARGLVRRTTVDEQIRNEDSSRCGIEDACTTGTQRRLTMDGERKNREEESRDDVRRKAAEEHDPETARRPAPGVKHEPEPDAGNIMPAENEPGTL